MKTLKINSEKDLYVAAFKLLNILGPLAGVSIIVGTVALDYVQTLPQDLPVTHILTKGDGVPPTGYRWRIPQTAKLNRLVQ